MGNIHNWKIKIKRGIGKERFVHFFSFHPETAGWPYLFVGIFADIFSDRK